MGDRKNNKKNGGGFQSLGLSDEIYQGINKMGFRIPTPVQRQSLPVILSGSDTVCMARTGSGKTAAFCIPLLERLLNSSRRKLQQQNSSSSASSQKLSASAVILSPTRELSLQTLKVLQNLSRFIEDPTIKCIGINGGESMEKQFSALSGSPDVVVATPGRLAHHLSEIPDFHLKQCELVIFDEADRLFEMGFAMQIRQICGAMPSTESGRQTLLFSATMPKVLVEFTKSGIMDTDPKVVRLDKDASVSEELRIGFVSVRSQEKDGALLHLLRDVLTMVPPTTTTTNTNTNTKNEQENVNENENENDNKKEKKHKKDKNGKERKKREESTCGLGLTLIFAATRHHVDYLTTLINNSGLNKRTGEVVATCIYGTMDQEARKSNLHSFRTGETPILVVTDVAARGIDVPLIDHVIHYSFPPSAKLFVHRSGRAARAGRVGYCWGLVDVEEMPYMIDLYLFLGRPLACGRNDKKEIKEEDDAGGEEKNESDTTSKGKKEDIYTLADMTPEMVHYGTVPESTITNEIENVRRIVQSELTGGHDADALQTLTRVCANAMKQYRRSRPDASREGIRRAKALLEGKKEESGERVGGGMIPAHPVLRFVERQRLQQMYINDNDQEGTSSKSLTEKQVDMKLQDLREREDFLRAMSSFRPKETVFEAFATGGGKVNGVVSHVDKGRTSDCNSQKKNDSSFAFAAMRNMRRQMKLAHNKGATLVVAGSHTAQVINGDEIDEKEEDEEMQQATDSNTAVASSKAVTPEPIHEKRRLSKAERKRMKKRGTTPSSQPDPSIISEKKTKEKRGSDFRDSAFYIDNEITNNSEENQRSRHIESAMQPSSSTGTDSMSSALKLEEAMLDIVGDENMDLVKRHRMMRWDKSKRKYIQTTLGDELSGDSKSKKLRLESGQLVKKDKVKLGELYDKWQKKTNKSIGRVGVFDDVTESAGDDELPTNTNSKKNGKKGKGSSSGESELKSVGEIRKKREHDKQKLLKNMKRTDRNRLEKAQRTKKNAQVVELAASGKGWQGKKGYSGRHGVVNKSKSRTKNF